MNRSERRACPSCGAKPPYYISQRCLSHAPCAGCYAWSCRCQCCLLRILSQSGINRFAKLFVGKALYRAVLALAFGTRNHLAMGDLNANLRAWYMTELCPQQVQQQTLKAGWVQRTWSTERSSGDENCPVEALGCFLPRASLHKGDTGTTYGKGKLMNPLHG